MPDKSKRELKRELESLRTSGPVDFEITTDAQTVMAREQAKAEGREILGEVSDTTRIATWSDADGEAIGGSPEVRVPDSVDLVEVAWD